MGKSEEGGGWNVARGLIVAAGLSSPLVCFQRGEDGFARRLSRMAVARLCLTLKMVLGWRGNELCCPPSAWPQRAASSKDSILSHDSGVLPSLASRLHSLRVLK